MTPPARSACGNARVAQLVEHVTENHGVGGSTPSPGTIGTEKLPQIRHFLALLARLETVVGSKVGKRTVGHACTIGLCAVADDFHRFGIGGAALSDRAATLNGCAVSARPAAPSTKQILPFDVPPLYSFWYCRRRHFVVLGAALRSLALAVRIYCRRSASVDASNSSKRGMPFGTSTPSCTTLSKLARSSGMGDIRKSGAWPAAIALTPWQTAQCRANVSRPRSADAASAVKSGSSLAAGTKGSDRGKMALPPKAKVNTRRACVR